MSGCQDRLESLRLSAGVATREFPGGVSRVHETIAEEMVMPDENIAGSGRKRPQLDVPVERLHPDPQNPRLPAESQGANEPELLKVLHAEFNLEELADSMATNGYFDEEPLVAIPKGITKTLARAGADPESSRYADYLAFIEDESTHFTVVEGNRRLATALLLLDANLRSTLSIRSWPAPSRKVAEDLRVLPVIIYPTRDAVVPYLGVRHIVGIQKWDIYPRARYIAQMVEEQLLSLDRIQEQIGDRNNSARKSYVCYKALQQVQDEFDIDTRPGQNDFSLLLLALGQGNIKRFLGLPKKWAEIPADQPVSKKYLPNLKKLYLWLFGDRDKKPVISESRDITNYLSSVVEHVVAVAHLEKTGRLEEAYDLSDGEEKMLLKYLANANTKLEAALGVAHRHKTQEVRFEADRCYKTATQLRHTLGD